MNSGLTDKEDQPSNYTPIPKLFYDDLTGVPMHQCISCECELLDSQVPYMIEKALKPYDGFRSYSTVFEYAMCMNCMKGYQDNISQKSMQRIQEYFATQLDLQNRKDLIANKSYSDLNLWVNNCFIKGLEVKNIGECQIYAQCIGDQLVMAEFPYMISGAALDEVVDLLSPETLDEFDRLKDELIGPPAFQDLLKGGPKVLL